MKTTQGQTLYVRIVVVEGSSPFPIDMLRYDSCVPFDEEDSHAIAAHSFTGRVRLKRFAKNPDGYANEKRWAAFGWKVVTDDLFDPWMPAARATVVR